MVLIDYKLKTRGDIASMVRNARQEASLSQVALAEAAGVSRQMIERVEAGKYNVTIDTLALIARVLGKQIIIS